MSERFSKEFITLNGDIYSMAYASFLDGELLTNKKNRSGFLADMKIDQDELHNVFFGVFLIIIF